MARGVYKLKIKAPQPITAGWIPAGKNQAFKIKIGTNGAWPDQGGGPAYIGTSGRLKKTFGKGNIYAQLNPGGIYEIKVNLTNLTYQIKQK